MTAILHVVGDDRAEWLEWRRAGIGASDAAAVAGFSPFDTPTSIYLKKIGFLRERADDEADWQRMGRLLEPVIARLFEEETGLRVIAQQARVSHPERPWQRATLDGIVENDDRPLGPIEIKSTTRWNGEWGTEPPDYYQAQLLHQLAVTGYERGWIATLTDVRRFRFWEIRRDDVAVDLLSSVEEAFWNRVLEHRPPPVDGSPRTNEALADAFKEPARPALALDAHGLDLVAELREARDERLRAEKAETAAQNAVLALLGGAEAATWQGQPAVKWSLLERETDDLDALREQLGELPKKKTTYRRLWLPKTKERRDGE